MVTNWWCHRGVGWGRVWVTAAAGNEDPTPRRRGCLTKHIGDRLGERLPPRLWLKREGLGQDTQPGSDPTPVAAGKSEQERPGNWRAGYVDGDPGMTPGPRASRANHSHPREESAWPAGCQLRARRGQVAGPAARSLPCPSAGCASFRLSGGEQGGGGQGHS